MFIICLFLVAFEVVFVARALLFYKTVLVVIQLFVELNMVNQSFVYNFCFF